MTAARLLSLVVAGLTTVAACSSCSSEGTADPSGGSSIEADADTTDTDTTDEASEVPFDDWVDTVGVACNELSDATPRIASDGQDAAALRAYFEEMAAVLGEHVDALTAAGVPDDRADDAAEYVAIAERRRDAFADAAGSVEDNADLAVEVLTDDAQDTFEAEELAFDLGIDDCTTLDTSDPDGGFSEQDRRDFIAGMMDASAITEEEAGCIADLVDADLVAGVLRREEFGEDPEQILAYLEQCLTSERLEELAS